MQFVMAIAAFEMFHAPVLLVMWLPLALVNFSLMENLGLLPFSARQIGEYIYLRLAVFPAVLAAPVIVLRAPQWQPTSETYLSQALDYSIAPLVGFIGCAMTLSLALIAVRLREEVTSAFQRQLLGVLPMLIGFAFAAAAFTTRDGAILPSRWSALDPTAVVLLSLALIFAVTGFVSRGALVRSLYASRIQFGKQSPQTRDALGVQTQKLSIIAAALPRNRWYYGKFGVLFYFIGHYSGRALLIFLGMALFYQLVGMHEDISTLGLMPLIFTHLFVSMWFEQIMTTTRALPVRVWKLVLALPAVWLLCQWPAAAVYLALSPREYDFLPHYFAGFLSTWTLSFALILRFQWLPALVQLTVPPLVVANALILLPLPVGGSMALAASVWGHVWLCMLMVQVKPRARLSPYAK